MYFDYWLTFIMHGSTQDIQFLLYTCQLHNVLTYVLLNFGQDMRV